MARKHEVDAGYRRGREVLLLAVDLAEKGTRVTEGALHVLDRPEQHAARGAGRVVDRISRLCWDPGDPTSRRTTLLGV